MIFVISPESVASDACLSELDAAVSLHKLVVPVMYRPVDGALALVLSESEWILLRDGDDRQAELERLVGALDADLEWRDQDTRIALTGVSCTSSTSCLAVGVGENSDPIHGGTVRLAERVGRQSLVDTENVAASARESRSIRGSPEQLQRRVVLLKQGVHSRWSIQEPLNINPFPLLKDLTGRLGSSRRHRAPLSEVGTISTPCPARQSGPALLSAATAL